MCAYCSDDNLMAGKINIEGIKAIGKLARG